VTQTADAESLLTLDVSTTRPPSFRRLVGVELRKSYDTRAGFWLLVAIGGVVLVVLAIATTITVVQDEPVLLGDFVAIAAYLTTVLLPLLAIMLVTSEWSQRSAMVTFTLEPRRVRVVLAKLVVGVLLTLLTLAVALVAGVVCTLICDLANPEATGWDLGLDGLAGFVVTQTLAMLGGFALATLLLNTPAAIVLFFVYRYALPGLFALGVALMDWFESVAPWLDFQAAQDDIYEWNLSGGEEWAHLIVSGLLWLGLPMAVGLWRILRAEVK
jgi:ABC-type transport system involved in multi-copper enzyme maturation permease subunit